MRHLDHHSDHHSDHGAAAPFDGDEFDAIERSDDLTAQFWGTGADWSDRTGRIERIGHAGRPERARPTHRIRNGDDTTGAIRVIRDGVAAFRPQRRELRDATGQVRRTRAHGRTPAANPAPVDERTHRDATIGELAAGRFDDPFSPRTDVADEGRDRNGFDGPEVAVVGNTPSRRVGFGAVDPLLARLGALIVVGVISIPVALAMRPADAATGSVVIDAPAVAVDAAGQPFASANAAPDESGPSAWADTAADAATPGASADTTGTASLPSQAVASSADVAATDAAATATASTDTSPTAASTTAEPVRDVTQSENRSGAQGGTASIDEPATADAPAERVEPECPQTYTAASGDSWYRIADAAGVTPSALLDENRATVDTVIFPGDDICLPAGAVVPQPPSTTAPTTTAAPVSTVAPTTTTAPTTTAPPAGSPGRDATPAEVRAVIRSVFPESQWETAYVIADRESRFDPTAYNGWCCYGVFQIYWNVHRGWLDDLGIDSADDLYDPLLNVQAAYAIYQRAGNSWSPWSTYG